MTMMSGGYQVVDTSHVQHAGCKTGVEHVEIGDTCDDEELAARREALQQGDREAHDQRALRIQHAAAFTKGVVDYRTRQLAKNKDGNNKSQKSSTAARVFARARPLFAHETERGEWDCVTADPAMGEVVIHCGSMRMSGRQGLVKTIGHQAYPAVTPVITDEDVYGAVQYLVQSATDGGKSTLFMYGMTGSGKTHSCEGIQQRAPTDLFKDLGDDDIIQVTAFELVGKRCFDLFSGEEVEEPLEGVLDGLELEAIGVDVSQDDNGADFPEL